MTAVRRFEGDSLALATHNRGKAAEFGALFAPLGVRIVAAGDLGLTAPAETGDTFEANAALKALAAARAAGRAALADDSGLSIETLGGEPGVRSADWEGPTRDPQVAMARVRAAMGTAIEDPAGSRAAFACVLAIAWPDGHVESVRGECRGRIVWPPRGSGGHGYDPIFLPDGFDRTFAELEAAEKNRISHRAAAFAALKARCF